jgi:hypothetical protein
MAIKTLKEKLSVNWTRLNTIANVTWYKCKECDSKLKLMVDENDRCSISYEHEHDFDGHLHEDEDGIVQVGLSEEVKKKVLHYFTTVLESNQWQ